MVMVGNDSLKVLAQHVYSNLKDLLTFLQPRIKKRPCHERAQP
jgi:hypothetical protein